MARRSFNPDRMEKNIIDIKTRKPAKSNIPVVCRQIRSFREKKQLSQKEFALELGITGNSISNWESGRARPDIYLIPDICRILDISPYLLFGLEEPDENLTDIEKKHIQIYRNLSPGHKKFAERMLEMLSEVESMDTEDGYTGTDPEDMINT